MVREFINFRKCVIFRMVPTLKYARNVTNKLHGVKNTVRKQIVFHPIHTNVSQQKTDRVHWKF